MKKPPSGGFFVPSRRANSMARQGGSGGSSLIRKGGGGPLRFDPRAMARGQRLGLHPHSYSPDSDSRRLGQVIAARGPRCRWAWVLKDLAIIIAAGSLPMSAGYNNGQRH